VSKRADSSNARCARRVMLGIILAGSMMPIAATAGTVFTWNPAGAAPSPGSEASAFTADAIDATHYLYDVFPTVSLPTDIYTVHFLEPITGFTLNGAPVATPGLNGSPGAAGSYGLYLTMQTQTEAVGPPDLSGRVALMLDPGNNNGAASSTLSGPTPTFSNTGPTGTADDITLATGSLVSGTFTFGAPNSGIRSIGDFVQTFQPAAGEGGFFVSPVSPHDLIELIDTTYATTPPEIVMVTDPSDPALTISMLNGGSTVIDFAVPEPDSFLLLGCGLFGLVAIRARNRRPR
jgi:PEP-CTERM motif